MSLASTKYLEQFQKRREYSNNKDNLIGYKSLPANESYTRFLEIQFEKVAEALVKVDNYADRIEKALLNIEDIDDKFFNMNKALKLIQNFVDVQEKENIEIHEKIQINANKLDDIYVKINRLAVLLDKAKQEDQNDIVYDEYGRRLTYNHKLLKNMKNISTSEKKFFNGSTTIQKQTENQLENLQNQLINDFEAKFAALNHKIDNQTTSDINVLKERLNNIEKKYDEKASLETKDKVFDFDKSYELNKEVTLSQNLVNERVNLKKEVNERKEWNTQIADVFSQFQKQAEEINNDMKWKFKQFDDKIANFDAIKSLNFEKKVLDDICNLRENLKILDKRLDGLNNSEAKTYEKSNLDSVHKQYLGKFEKGMVRFGQVLRKLISKQRLSEEKIKVIYMKLNDFPVKLYNNNDVQKSQLKRNPKVCSKLHSIQKYPSEIQINSSTVNIDQTYVKETFRDHSISHETHEGKLSNKNQFLTDKANEIDTQSNMKYNLDKENHDINTTQNETFRSFCTKEHLIENDKSMKSKFEYYLDELEFYINNNKPNNQNEALINTFSPLINTKKKDNIKKSKGRLHSVKKSKSPSMSFLSQRSIKSKVRARSQSSKLVNSAIIAYGPPRSRSCSPGNKTLISIKKNKKMNNLNQIDSRKKAKVDSVQNFMVSAQKMKGNRTKTPEFTMKTRSSISSVNTKDKIQSDQIKKNCLRY